MGTEVEFPYLQEWDPNWTTIHRQYENVGALGDAWIEKRKIAEKNRKLPSGEFNPMYPRYALEEEVARLTYHMAYLLEKNRILSEQVAMLSPAFERLAILEGAYGHLMTMVQSQKIAYFNQLKEKANARQTNDTSQGGTR